MKKSKVLIATLALSAALMGTGYAYWTKTLTVDATVTSAKFDVYFSDANATKAAGTQDGKGVNNYYNKFGENTNANLTKANLINDEKDTVTYSWNNIYPGSEATFDFTITNDSTIPVHAKPLIEVNAQALGEKETEAISEAITYTVVVGETTVCTDAKQGEMKTALEALDTTVAENGGTLKVTITAKMPESVVDIDAEDDKVTIKAKMVWGQFNDGNPTEPTPTE